MSDGPLPQELSGQTSARLGIAASQAGEWLKASCPAVAQTFEQASVVTTIRAASWLAYAGDQETIVAFPDFLLGLCIEGRYVRLHGTPRIVSLSVGSPTVEKAS